MKRGKKLLLKQNLKRYKRPDVQIIILTLQSKCKYYGTI